MNITVNFSVLVAFITLTWIRPYCCFFMAYVGGKDSLEDCYFASAGQKNCRCFISKHWLNSLYLWKPNSNSLALVLTHFSPVAHFYLTFSHLTFSRGIEMWCCTKMGSTVPICCRMWFMIFSWSETTWNNNTFLYLNFLTLVKLIKSKKPFHWEWFNPAFYLLILPF